MPTTLEASRSTRTPRVAIAGNPNTGKTTLFNRLTGSNLRVGNYPGVTVECHSGELRLPAVEGSAAHAVTLLDIPGTYSLSARSREEQIAVRAVAGLSPLDPPDLVVIVVDATQLARNLYLTLQILETGVPAVIALNMADQLAPSGLEIDVAALSHAIGCPVVAVSAQHGTGLDELRREIAETLATPERGRSGWRWRPDNRALGAGLAAVVDELPAVWRSDRPDRDQALAAWALLSLDENDELDDVPAGLRAIVAARRESAAETGRDIEAELIQGRYAWIDEITAGIVRQRETPRASLTERIDRVLLHPILGFAIFLLVMGVLFESLFSWSDPLIGLVESLFAAISSVITDLMPAGIVRDFVVDGLIAGVGSVLVFLPQILLLFLFIGLLEASGYMARVAFVMDRLMRMLGLHGRAFVPMLSGFACAVPAILATRTMERHRDRMLTMMVIPLMTCSARLPVYTLIIGALYPERTIWGFLPLRALMLMALYLFGTLCAFAALAVLSRTLFKGPRVPLLLELPPYRLPNWRSVLRLMWLKSRVFLSEAGGVILVCTIVLWFLLSFPRSQQIESELAASIAVAGTRLEGDAVETRIAALEAEASGRRLRESYGGRLGHAIEPVLEPLGFDWKLGVGIVGAFAAREVFVSTLGIVYGVGSDVDEESVTLREKIRSERRVDGRVVYTPLVGLSLLVFFALACQCMSTLAVVKRETHSWRWPIFMFVYMTALAWLASFAVYQGGQLLGFA